MFEELTENYARTHLLVPVFNWPRFLAKFNTIESNDLN